jgi:hypothetical protein
MATLTTLRNKALDLETDFNSLMDAQFKNKIGVKCIYGKLSQLINELREINKQAMELAHKAGNFDVTREMALILNRMMNDRYTLDKQYERDLCAAGEW